MNKSLQAVLESMEREPENWVRARFTFANLRTRTEVWTANGFWFYGLYRPKEVTWSFADKWRFGRALKRWDAARDYTGLADDPAPPARR
jgi:hypothetical protein